MNTLRDRMGRGPCDAATVMWHLFVILGLAPESDNNETSDWRAHVYQEQSPVYDAVYGVFTLLLSKGLLVGSLEEGYTFVDVPNRYVVTDSPDSPGRLIAHEDLHRDADGHLYYLAELFDSSTGTVHRSKLPARAYRDHVNVWGPVGLPESR